MVTVQYTIVGCVGTDRLHIHENLVPGPQAGSDPIHQVNFDFDIGKDSPTQQTVPLLDSAAGKCWVQVDYSTARERKGFFVPTVNCPTPSSSPPPSTSTPPPSTSTPPPSTSTPPPSTSTPPPSTSTPPPSTSTPPPSTSSSAGVAGIEASQSAVAQLGPIPQTGYTGTVATRSHPFWWATILGGAFLIAGLAGAIGSFAYRRGPNQ
jgi:hypothetical protein